MPKLDNLESWKNYINNRFKIMDQLKVPLESEWAKNYAEYLGVLMGRSGARGEELNDVNINYAKEKSDVVIRFATKMIRDEKYINLRPRTADDVEADKIMTDIVKYYISMFPAWDELSIKWMMQAVIKGLSPAKIIPKIGKNSKLESVKCIPVNISHLWLDPTWAVGLVRDLFLLLEYTELDLQNNKFFDKTVVKDMINGDGGKDGEQINIFKNTVFENTADSGDPFHPSEIKTKSDVEGAEKKYKVKEYWYLNTAENGDEEWLLEVWGLKGDRMEYLLRKETKPLYWFGHPFVIAMHNIHMYDAYGTGEPKENAQYQIAVNRILNQNLDYNDLACNPTVLLRKTAYDDTSDLRALENPRLGGIAVLNDIGPGAVDYFKIPPLGNTSAFLLSYVEEGDERASVRNRYLSGAGPQQSEPLGTTQINRSQSLDVVDFKLGVLSIGLKTLVEKMVILVQQYKPVSDILRVSGRRGYKFLKLGSERATKEESLISKTINDKTNEEEKTINLTATKKEALKSWDVFVSLESVQPPELIIDRNIKFLTLLINGKVQGVLTDVNFVELLRETMDTSGFRNTDDILPEDTLLKPSVNRFLAKLPPEILLALIQEIVNKGINTPAGQQQMLQKIAEQQSAQPPVGTQVQTPIQGAGE